jgi:hypothetical protein
MELSHLRRKNRDAPKVGHPDLWRVGHPDLWKMGTRNPAQEKGPALRLALCDAPEARGLWLHRAGGIVV